MMEVFAVRVDLSNARRNSDPATPDLANVYFPIRNDRHSVFGGERYLLDEHDYRFLLRFDCVTPPMECRTGTMFVQFNWDAFESMSIPAASRSDSQDADIKPMKSTT